MVACGEPRGGRCVVCCAVGRACGGTGAAESKGAAAVLAGDSGEAVRQVATPMAVPLSALWWRRVRPSSQLPQSSCVAPATLSLSPCSLVHPCSVGFTHLHGANPSRSSPVLQRQPWTIVRPRPVQRGGAHEGWWPGGGKAVSRPAGLTLRGEPRSVRVAPSRL
jgi:hypothetical protein